MIINVTDEEVIEMGKLAILASKPMGLGIFHFNPHLKKEDINLKISERGLYIDYYEGRMVKFYARKTTNGYDFNERISADYQSWICKYDSYETLALIVHNGN